jgi:hypothetical protein
MKKYVILSTDKNPDYAYFEPLTVWAWKQFGWTPLVMKLEVEGYRPATIAQISRLYAACIIEDAYIMTADIDLIPLSDYWHPNFNAKTVWGYDLTDYTEFPISYIGMQAEEWRQVMHLQLCKPEKIQKYIKRDLDGMPNTHSENFYEWWGLDQQLITKRLKPYNPKLIERGRETNGLAFGRVDRASWTLSLTSLVDAHLPQQVYHKGREKYFEQMMELLHHVWPEEDFTWFYDFTVEFKRLTGHA